MKTIADWKAQNPLILARSAQKVSQAYLAVVVGVSVQTIQNWEYRGSRPSEPNMKRLMATLEVYDLDNQWNRWEGQKPKK